MAAPYLYGRHTKIRRDVAETSLSSSATSLSLAMGRGIGRGRLSAVRLHCYLSGRNLYGGCSGVGGLLWRFRKTSLSFVMRRGIGRGRLSVVRLHCYLSGRNLYGGCSGVGSLLWGVQGHLAVAIEGFHWGFHWGAIYSASSIRYHPEGTSGSR